LRLQSARERKCFGFFWGKFDTASLPSLPPLLFGRVENRTFDPLPTPSHSPFSRLSYDLRSPSPASSSRHSRGSRHGGGRRHVSPSPARSGGSGASRTSFVPHSAPAHPDSALLEHISSLPPVHLRVPGGNRRGPSRSPEIRPIARSNVRLFTLFLCYHMHSRSIVT